MKICISAGHHQASKGAVNKFHNLNEYDEALKVCTPLAQLLIDAGHEVHQVQGSLRNKVRMVNEGGYDLALDIHFNADYDHLDPDDLDDTRGHGAMVMYCPKAKTYRDDEPLSKRRDQASLMSRYLNRALGNRDLGGRAGWYWGQKSLDIDGLPTVKDYFLCKTNCAAFIPEPGYIDNNHFAETWLVSNRHSEIARAIADGINNVFKEK